MRFNVVNWREGDEIEEESYTYKNKKRTRRKYKYIIKAYGRTEKDETVFLKINEFTPYIFFKPEGELDIDEYIKNLITYKKGERTLSYLKREFVGWKYVEKKDFYGFKADKKETFVLLKFKSKRAKTKFANRIRGDGYKIYESKIKPLMRFMHIKNIGGASWINFNIEDCKESENTICNYNYEINWLKVKKNKDMETKITKLKILAYDIECTSGDGSFPQPTRKCDKIIQIGATISRYGSEECEKKYILTLDTCDKIEGAKVVSCKTEIELLRKWFQLLNFVNPDIIVGYNNHYFDDEYIKERCKLLGLITTKPEYEIQGKNGKIGQASYKIVPNEQIKLKSMSREEGDSKFRFKTLSSPGLGDNRLKFFDLAGRVNIDLMKFVQKHFKLGSYKLDNVLEKFIKCEIKSFEIKENKTILVAKHIKGLYINNYLRFNVNGKSYLYGKKYKILELDEKDNKIIIDGKLNIDKENNLEWCLVKNDVSPNDIFRLQKGTSSDRKKLGEYCLQDCASLNYLIQKLDVLTQNICIANLCHAPLDYLFLNGQGAILFSIVSKYCRMKGFIIHEILEEDIMKIAGAQVIIPKFIGRFTRPVSVDDFKSLYPSCIIEKNISHETHVDNPKYDNHPDYDYIDIYFNLDGSDTEIKCIYCKLMAKIKKINGVYRCSKCGRQKKKCRYARRKDGEPGVIPLILKSLLDERARVKGLLKIEKDPYRKSILDGQQLALKIVANSLYGILGANTSSVRLKDLAASTTAMGRLRLNYAKRFAEKRFCHIVSSIIEDSDEKFKEYMKKIMEKYKPDKNEIYKGKIKKMMASENIIKYIKEIFKKESIKFLDNDIYIKDNILIINKKIINNDDKHLFHIITKARILDVLEGDKFNYKAKCVYGDTDSIFVEQRFYYRKNEKEYLGKDLLNKGIQMSVIMTDLKNIVLDYPQVLEYEKTFFPLILFGKKQYTGRKYEFNPKKYKDTDMGISLKRRDIAPITKKIVGYIRTTMLDMNNDIKGIFIKVENMIKKMMNGEFPIDDFILTKTLKTKYKSEEIAMKQPQYAVAQKMIKRDPGNKPQPNDRIKYVYIKLKNEKKGTLSAKKAEDVNYVIKNKLSIDYAYYLTNHIMKPALSFLNVLAHGTNINPSKIFERAIYRDKYKQYDDITKYLE